jgi:hypothetical protein
MGTGLFLWSLPEVLRRSGGKSNHIEEGWIYQVRLTIGVTLLAVLFVL